MTKAQERTPGRVLVLYLTRWEDLASTADGFILGGIGLSQRHSACRLPATTMVTSEGLQSLGNERALQGSCPPTSFDGAPLATECALHAARPRGPSALLRSGPRPKLALIDCVEREMPWDTRGPFLCGLVSVRLPEEQGSGAPASVVRTLALADHELVVALKDARMRPMQYQVPLTNVDDPELVASAEMVFRAIDERADPREVQMRLASCAANAVRLLAGAAARCRSSLPSPSAKRIRRVLQEHVTDDICLDDLAGAVALSRAYVVRSFQRSTGLTPHEYLMHLRMAQARTLLWRGIRPTDVAYSCGFCDQSHLNRWFRKALGATPVEHAALRVA